MKISVVGTGYVGLVSGVSLSEIGHIVTCIDIDEEKVKKMNKGISPIYEPGLSDLMKKNMSENKLFFTTDHRKGFYQAEVIYIAVGTPEKEDGSANLAFIEEVAISIAKNITMDTIVVTKSTVPVGTNHKIKQLITENLLMDVKVDIISNPEFLREGSAIHDSFHGHRIVVGSESEYAARVIERINEPFGTPIFHTTIESAEMIKYASNAFLATKISFINEISNICERVNANVEEVAIGMGLDPRIGPQFLKAGIGYGGSCFPKDTKALMQIAGNVHYDFELLKGVINVNKKQQVLVLEKLREVYSSFNGLKVGVLGLAFKPNTDDIREAPSLSVITKLINEGAKVIAYDPVAIEKAKEVLPKEVNYSDIPEGTLTGVDAIIILTEWEQIRSIKARSFHQMKRPVVIDGRNCFDPLEMAKGNIEYMSIGRPHYSIPKREVLS